jgi:hypothetical protein
MRKILAGVFGLLLTSGIAYAVNTIGANSTSPVQGDIATSPIVVCGSFNYNGGPQTSTVNACGGTFQANSGTAVTVANPYVDANSVIVFGLKTVGGTPAAPFMVTVTPGTGFTVNSGGSDTSTYNYWILG